MIRLSIVICLALVFLGIARCATIVGDWNKQAEAGREKLKINREEIANIMNAIYDIRARVLNSPLSYQKTWNFKLESQLAAYKEKSAERNAIISPLMQSEVNSRPERRAQLTQLAKEAREAYDESNKAEETALEAIESLDYDWLDDHDKALSTKKEYYRRMEAFDNQLTAPLCEF